MPNTITEPVITITSVAAITSVAVGSVRALGDVLDVETACLLCGDQEDTRRVKDTLTFVCTDESACDERWEQKIMTWSAQAHADWIAHQ